MKDQEYPPPTGSPENTSASTNNNNNANTNHISGKGSTDNNGVEQATVSSDDTAAKRVTWAHLNMDPSFRVKPKHEGADDFHWYAAPDGSFFLQRRHPFFRFNFLMYAINLALFIYFVVIVSKDFLSQRHKPPTTSRIDRDIKQNFPGILICNMDRSVPIDIVYAGFKNDDSDTEGSNITDRFQRLVCEAGDTNSTNMTDDTNLQSTLTSDSCWLLNDPFPAFRYDDESESSGGCTGMNMIDMFININAEQYSNSSLFLGVTGHLFTAGTNEAIVETICSATSPLCRKLPSSFENCENVSKTAVSFDTFQASSSFLTLLTLKRSERQSTPRCDQKVVRWNPESSIMTFNPRGLEFLEGTRVTRSVVAMEFRFYTPEVTKAWYNPISGQSLFGSLSGWFGFLSDGWGILSLLFFCERAFLYLRDQYQYLEE